MVFNIVIGGCGGRLGMKKNIRTEALVELIDLYPSLCELANIKAPDYLEGTSFVPLMKNPKQAWKKATFSNLLQSTPYGSLPTNKAELNLTTQQF